MILLSNHKSPIAQLILTQFYPLKVINKYITGSVEKLRYLPFPNYLAISIGSSLPIVFHESWMFNFFGKNLNSVAYKTFYFLLD